MDQSGDLAQTSGRFDERMDGLARGRSTVATLTSYPTFPKASAAALALS
jgi:hypothetical protein